MSIETSKQRNIEELEERLDRSPSETDLIVKRVAEEEAYETIKATPSRQYVPDEVIEDHWDRLHEEIETRPLDPHKELFREIFTEEVRDENMNREMRM